VALKKAQEQLLKELEQVDLDSTITRIKASRDLGASTYHFKKHGDLLGVSSQEEYLSRLEQHLQREDLEFFVYKRKDGQVMWYAVNLDSQEVVQYNASRGRLWSYYFDEDFGAFVREGGLLRIARKAGLWEVDP
jgi:hypothetical protein